VEWIVEAAPVHQGPLRIAVVGSAFGLEIRDALARLEEAARAAISVALLDLDPAAIDFARANLAALLKPEQLAAISTNLFRLPERTAAAEPLRGSQWIFCPGMFDYLDDVAAIAMIQCLYGQLTPGGRLIVFQFAPHNPTRAYMEWLGNWYLTYRDAAALGRLVESANLSGAEVSYGAEALGVDLYAMIRNQPVE
jgi:extracellular factor (EF) 3-hydroxypalmitic acid methyl ester biosynthesis protein